MNKLEYLNKELGTKYTSIDEVDWGDVSCYQHLTENFMRIFCDDLNWDDISKYQNLTEPFIRKFKKKVNWDNISKYQKLSEEFREKHHIKVDKEDIWLYKTTEEKKQAVKGTGSYYCFNDYFIAYKAIRSDRSSLETKRYIYNKGETYCANCDTTKEWYSFGLSAWTYKGAQYDGGADSIIVRVKIYYEDVGRVVNLSDRIRCFKFTVLD